MKKTIKLFALVSLFAAAIGAQAGTTNLLQAVTVEFTVFSQGPSNITASGLTNYMVEKSSFKTKDLIKAVSATSNYENGDVLVRVTPVTNAMVNVTNLVPVGTNTLTLTNTSTSNTSNNYVLILDGTAVATNGDTNITFGTNIEDFGTNEVTLGTNTVVVGTNAGINIIVGTNTTVTLTTLTNGIGSDVGTNYVFVSNTLTNEPTTTNVLGTPYWAIFLPKTKTLTPISTNVVFSIRTDDVYDDGTNLARIHGETITKNHVIKFGTTEEIRTLVLSNNLANVKLQGYAHGHYVPIQLGKDQTSYSQDFSWTGSGSGLYTNAPIVLDGAITEEYYKFLTQ